jgi:hypothetical protein
MITFREPFESRRPYDHFIRPLKPWEQKVYEGRDCCYRGCKSKPTYYTRHKNLLYFGLSQTVRQIMCDDHAAKFRKRHKVEDVADVA